MEGCLTSLTFLNNPAFKHSDKTHTILQFLQEALSPVAPNSGTWNLWYDADRQAPLARDECKANIPPEKKRTRFRYAD